MSLPQELDRLKIPLASIKLATNNFAQDNFLGQGGFGKVYRGQLPVSSTTRPVAVKRLDTKHGQGQKEFLMEIFMLSSYKHDNLVSLIGFCDQDGEKILVYKQEAYGSLDSYLASPDLTWEQRLRICLGAARGLDYLHNGVGDGHRVIHRDIKSSNILLDANWEAKISDFGLSKIGPTNQEFTFLVSSVAGTYGYVDPIYVETGVLTKESDVYSFGIVLFEVACERLAMVMEYEDDRKFLSSLVNRHNKNSKLHLIVPSDLRNQMTLKSYTTFRDIALKCLKKVPKERPTMQSVVKALETALKHQHDGSIMSDRQIGARLKLLGVKMGGRLLWLFQLASNQKPRNSGTKLSSNTFGGTSTDSHSLGIKHGFRSCLFQLASNQKSRNSETEFSSNTFGGTTADAKSLGQKIPFSKIRKATKNFDKTLILGAGGFGKVYKGVLENGLVVAVKRGNPKSHQGFEEFKTEIEMLSKLCHRHIVFLIGYCKELNEMILVYEFMAGGPLSRHLYGSNLPPLTWKQRIEILVGAAKGLHYLHTGVSETIIHRDVKTSNILLDENLDAKVADFGVSKFGPSINQTHVSTVVKGTFGYLDPEYYHTQQLTEKSDVYSFGVVMLEVLCARPPIDGSLPREEVNIAELAMTWQKKGALEQIMDKKIMGSVNLESLRKFGETAEQCLSDNGNERPSMGDVLWNLEYALRLQEPSNGRSIDADSVTSNAHSITSYVGSSDVESVDYETISDVESNGTTRD